MKPDPIRRLIADVADLEERCGMRPEDQPMRDFFGERGWCVAACKRDARLMRRWCRHIGLPWLWKRVKRVPGGEAGTYVFVAAPPAMPIAMTGWSLGNERRK